MKCLHWRMLDVLKLILESGDNVLLTYAMTCSVVDVLGCAAQ